MQVVLCHLGDQKTIDQMKPLVPVEDAGGHHRLVLIQGQAVERRGDPAWVRLRRHRFRLGSSSTWCCSRAFALHVDLTTAWPHAALAQIRSSISTGMRVERVMIW